MKNKIKVLCVNKILFHYRYEGDLDFKRRCEREEKLGGSGSRRNLEGNLPAVTPSCRGFCGSILHIRLPALLLSA